MPTQRGPGPEQVKREELEKKQAISTSDLKGLAGPNKPTCASEYGGPQDPSSGTKGYKGDTLTGKMAFAELGMGTALGNLPYKAKIAIEYNGKIVTAEKLDIGAGGPGCGGYSRTIDLWWETAAALGFSGLGVVKYSNSYTKAQQQAVGQEIKKNPCEVNTGVPLVGGGVDAVAEGFCKAGMFFSEFGKILGFLSSSSGWLRIGKVVLGGILIIVAVDELTKIGPGPESNIAGRTAGGATKSAGAAKAVAKSPVGKLALAKGNPLDALE